MSYRFKERESTEDAVKRIALQQLDEALELTKAKTSFDEAVHDVRVCFKKLRGLIRLVRDELGKETYQRENRFYRDINRALSEVRDTAALLEIFEKLTKRFSEELNDDAFPLFRKSISAAKRIRQAEKKRALVKVRKSIATAHNRAKRWSIKSDDFPTVGKGLLRTYRRGKGGFDRAYDRQTVPAFHEWRKDTKYFWYHIKLVRELWPAQLKDFAGEIKDLVDYLSDDHDLALLRKQALKQSRKAKDGHQYEALLALIDKRRAELETRACFLGQRIYAEESKAFSDRFHEYWRAWHAEEKIDPIAAT